MKKSGDEAFHPVVAVDSRVGVGEMSALNAIENL